MEVSSKFKNTKDWVRYNKDKMAMIIYAVCLCVAACILIGIYEQPAVAVCAMLIIDTLLIVCLRDSHLWIHGILLVLLIISGILMEKTAIVVLLSICYVIGAFSLLFIRKER